MDLKNETLISLGENSKSKTTQSWLALGETWSTVHLPLLLSFLIVKLRLQLIANIAILLHPFLPFSSSKVSEWLGVELKWEEQDIGVKIIPRDISILFSKID